MPNASKNEPKDITDITRIKADEAVKKADKEKVSEESTPKTNNSH